MFFWTSLAFSMIQQMLTIWSLVPLSFLNLACTFGNSLFRYCWSLAWRIFEHYLARNEHNCAVVWTLFGIALLWDGMKTDLFQSCGHCWVFQICWHIEYSNLTAPSFRIWNSLTGIPSPLLALFLVILPKAHFTSHFRMSSSRWVITPPWLSRLLRPFLYSSSVYSFQLFLVSSISVRFWHFCPLSYLSLHEICPWNLQFSWRDIPVDLVNAHRKLLTTG